MKLLKKKYWKINFQISNLAFSWLTLNSIFPLILHSSIKAQSIRGRRFYCRTDQVENILKYGFIDKSQRIQFNSISFKLERLLLGEKSFCKLKMPVKNNNFRYYFFLLSQWNIGLRHLEEKKKETYLSFLDLKIIPSVCHIVSSFFPSGNAFKWIAKRFSSIFSIASGGKWIFERLLIFIKRKKNPNKMNPKRR